MPRYETSLPHAVRDTENVWITLSDGCRLAARVWLPVPEPGVPVPAILEYIPYRKRDFMRRRDEGMHRWFAGHGYAAVRVDMRGSGESDGVMHDEYLAQEQDDALEVIDWIARQSWCSGKVGMMGKSWGAYNSLQVAARRPPALKAIIAVMGTDDRFAECIHFSGGCLLNDNFWWGCVMQMFNARPPDPAIVGERWRAMWLERLEAERFWPEIWLEHQALDDYWKHGSVCFDYGAIEIRPAAPEPGRAFDRAVVEAHRAVLPVIVQRLMPQPELRPEPLRLESLQPHRAPTLAHDGRVRRPGVEHLHHAAPPEVVIEQAPAREVDAFGEAVVGAHDCDDGFERGRPPCRDLHGIVGAPGLPHHADLAGAPRLARDPVDHFERVVLLLRQVLIVHDSVGLARAAHVDAHCRVAVPRKPVVHPLVAPPHEIALTIGDVLEDRGNRHPGLVVGQPEARGQPATIRQRDPDILDVSDCMRQRCLIA